jgi:hypothetical protein
MELRLFTKQGLVIGVFVSRPSAETPFENLKDFLIYILSFFGFAVWLGFSFK